MAVEAVDAGVLASSAASPRAECPAVGVGIGVPPSVGATQVGAVRREGGAVTGEPEAANALNAEAAVAGADVLGIHVDETRLRALDLDACLAESVRPDAGSRLRSADTTV